MVWEGLSIGIFDSWEKVLPLVKGYKGAKYKSFSSLSEAQAAFRSGWEYFNLHSNKKNILLPKDLFEHTICVDAACRGNPGAMQYRAVKTDTQEELFRKTFDIGTNNIGEFLAIVDALAFIQKHNLLIHTIYSDSKVAIKWVERKTVCTQLARNEITEPIWRVIDHAVDWLHQHTYSTAVKKWETDKWGENPADFGHK